MTAAPAAMLRRVSQRRDEDDEDRDGEVAPVDARVAQERRGAEEARVRVRDLEVAREDELARRALPEPDDAATTIAIPVSVPPSASGSHGASGARAAIPTSSAKGK